MGQTVHPAKIIDEQMSGEGEAISQSNFYNGIAPLYAQYRPHYPAELIEKISSHFDLKDANGRLLDIGCGTGELSIPLSEYFSEVVAIDLDADMINVLNAKCGISQNTKIQARAVSAENFEAPSGSFKLTTFGTSFHWVDKQRVTKKVHNFLAHKGGIAIITAHAFQNLETEWKRIVFETIAELTGQSKHPAQNKSNSKTSNEIVLQSSGFIDMVKGQFTKTYFHDWSNLWGYICTQSFASPVALGDQYDNFKNAIHEKLGQSNSTAKFSNTINFEYIFAIKG